MSDIVDLLPVYNADPTPAVSAQVYRYYNVYGSRVSGSESVPVRSQGKIQQLASAAPLSGTGGQMEAYAILSWLSHLTALMYLVRGCTVR